MGRNPGSWATLFKILVTANCVEIVGKLVVAQLVVRLRVEDLEVVFGRLQHLPDLTSAATEITSKCDRDSAD